MSDAPTTEMHATLADFLDRLAARTPTPGGGGAAALTGAVGCALAGMVANYSIGKRNAERSDGTKESLIQAATLSLRRAGDMLRRLVDEDAAAYTELATARRSFKANPAQADAYQLAVHVAMSVPLEVAAVSAAALEAMDGIKGVASTPLLCDLGVAAQLTLAAARAASYCVRVNAAELNDAAQRNAVLAQLDTILVHAGERAHSVATFVHGPSP